MAGPGSWGPPPQGYGHSGGASGPAWGPPPQGRGGPPPGYGGPGGYGAAPPPGYGAAPPPGYGPPPRPPYGPGPGMGPYGGPGYRYVPPRGRRPRRGPARGIGILGVLALVGVGGALVHAATRHAAAPAPPPVAAPPATRGGNGGDAATSRLYQVGRLPSTGCRGRQITQGDPHSFRLFLDGTTDCLDQAWRQGFERAGLRFSAPQRVFWSTPGRSPCGDYPAPGVAAFYCPANASMYIGVTDAQRAAGGMPVRYNVAYAREIAHEYGHAVQDLSGILTDTQRQRAAATTTLARNAVTKRSELQAQCLSGVFMRSVRGTFPVTSPQWSVALRDSYGRGDDGRPLADQDHGTDAHYRGWLQKGFTQGTTAACNTWTAPTRNVR